MADACLFHATTNFTYSYGPSYENDTAKDHNGDCRYEINLVRDRVNDNMQRYVHDKIDLWRAHKAVAGNEATLIVLGYGRFFSLDEACDKWYFNVFWNREYQYLVKEMRKEFNDIVSAGPPSCCGAVPVHLTLYFLRSNASSITDGPHERRTPAGRGGIQR